MVARRIALVKPASAADEKVTHALQLFDSILWAFQGTSSRTSWTVVAPDAADVIVVYEADPDQRIAAWRAQGKLIVEFAVAEPTSAALVYPFRAAQALALLERLDTQLKAQGEPPPPKASTADPWSFVETLRTIREVREQRSLVGCPRWQGCLAVAARRRRDVRSRTRHRAGNPPRHDAARAASICRKARFPRADLRHGPAPS